MHAIKIQEPGGPDMLVWSEVPDPEPGPGEVIVDVRASGVNRGDILQRQGHYPPPPGASPYPGLECSGTISAIADDVRGWTVGQQVCALLAGGGYAERVAVPAGQLLPVPDGVDLVDSAALPEVACTVWSNVVRLARLTAGETLLVHGGGSGIGTFAIQLGSALGATVAATARLPKHDQLRKLGAAHTIDYREQDFVEEVRQVTDSRGADVILDIIGAAYLERNLAALATGGRLMVIGMQGGRKAELDLAGLLVKRAAVAATALRPLPLAEKAEIVRGVREQVWPLIAAGRIRPIVDRRLPLTDAAEAHRLVESSEHVGKVLLTVG
ncbi:NAD(P)H-quinone oxidoreductase [Salinispora arenicola]|uniref:NAD(P)H-quinone oxidoreductase n=1 Tax=Salinispora arenicola TaxID=168697 RepID=UPI0002D3893F|nr:NAD(P)H-quinone oxidoreductase [Salinispora arenicola]MCN0177807.1 NAD(P)H-quinone oxidoreductase [Salinispora arenicola]NIL41922.1 NAD(P)H-quinone oxidoreductase [Salinispora arenicola]